MASLQQTAQLQRVLYIQLVATSPLWLRFMPGSCQSWQLWPFLSITVEKKRKRKKRNLFHYCWQMLLMSRFFPHQIRQLPLLLASIFFIPVRSHTLVTRISKISVADRNNNNKKTKNTSSQLKALVLKSFSVHFLSKLVSFFLFWNYTVVLKSYTIKWSCRFSCF